MHSPITDALLLKEIGYVLDHPGTLGRVGAYLKRLESDRAVLVKALEALVSMCGDSDDFRTRKGHQMAQARAALAQAGGMT